MSRFYKYSFSSPKTSSHPTLPHEQHISQLDNNTIHQFIPTIANPLTPLTSTKKFSKRPTVDPLYTPISQTKATLTAQIAQLTPQTYSLLKTHTSQISRSCLYPKKKIPAPAASSYFPPCGARLPIRPEVVPPDFTYITPC